MNVKKIIIGGIIIILLIVGSFIGGWLWGNGAGTNASRIVDLENTIVKLSAENNNFAALNNRLGQENAELRKIVDGLSSTIGGAGKNIQDALETIGRLEKLCNEIGN